MAATLTIYDLFVVIKINQTPNFGGNYGLFSGPTSTPGAIAQSGTSKWQDLGFGAAYEYRKNNVLFANANQQAPMNVKGLCHFRFYNGIVFTTSFQMCKDRSTAGTFLPCTIYDIVYFTALNPVSDNNELADHLMRLRGVS